MYTQNRTKQQRNECGVLLSPFGADYRQTNKVRRGGRCSRLVSKGDVTLLTLNPLFMDNIGLELFPVQNVLPSTSSSLKRLKIDVKTVKVNHFPIERKSSDLFSFLWLKTCPNSVILIYYYYHGLKNGELERVIYFSLVPRSPTAWCVRQTCLNFLLLKSSASMNPLPKRPPRWPCG